MGLNRIHECIEMEDLEGLRSALAEGGSADSGDDDYPEFRAIFRAIDISNEGRHHNSDNTSELRAVRMLLDAGCSLTDRYKGEDPYEFACTIWHFEAAALVNQFRSRDLTYADKPTSEAFRSRIHLGFLGTVKAPSAGFKSNLLVRATAGSSPGRCSKLWNNVAVLGEGLAETRDFL
jgi:hypothetical protein